MIRAANSGDKTALYILGQLYENGRGVPQDTQLAFHFFEQAAQQNHAEAQYKVARMYIADNEIKEDIKKIDPRAGFIEKPVTKELLLETVKQFTKNE